MSALDQMYQDVILDHSKRRIGEGLAAPDESPLEGETAAGCHHEYNPTCGDEILVRVGVDGDRISSLSWQGDGCSISMAAASVLSEMAPGTDLGTLRIQIEEFREMLRSRGNHEPDEELLGDAVAFVGVSRFVARVKCAALAWVATEAALTKALAESA
ncbi:SUF system NifU family Fe-S cluster assembly protein [Kocuria soli]|uniref:SUF system NifU family Fe-S cluster assembly protein n=1 Tax=Kocuria soli TaxID=2485125 RepID=A0A3N3ZTR6_9MICC|nr:SUF system NifU family Fe-S cluster assembly protein [Kocuria soli]ROZ63255.1 SUF system NifU family Fe-S cluster assembly protein [Kocuria soli]